jgi:hypothetical protein
MLTLALSAPLHLACAAAPNAADFAGRMAVAQNPLDAPVAAAPTKSLFAPASTPRWLADF